MPLAATSTTAAEQARRKALKAERNQIQRSMEHLVCRPPLPGAWCANKARRQVARTPWRTYLNAKLRLGEIDRLLKEQRP